jgi:hypothetical protein
VRDVFASFGKRVTPAAPPRVGRLAHDTAEGSADRHCTERGLVEHLLLLLVTVIESTLTAGKIVLCLAPAL